MKTESTTTKIVKAIEPTVLGSQGYFHLRESDLAAGMSVDAVYLLPGDIDVEKLHHALAQTLSFHPVFAGRFEREDPDGWRIRLSNDGVPVTVLDVDDTEPMPSDTIVQAPLKRVIKLDTSGFLRSGSSDSPLLCLTITRFRKTGETAIGISSSHMLGDGFAAHKLHRTLSQFYQGFDASEDFLSYVPYKTTPVTPEQVAAAETTWMDRPFPAGTIPDHFNPEKTPPAVRIDFRLRKDQLESMRSGLVKRALAKGTKDSISTQDCLSSVIAASYSRSDPSAEPVRIVSTLLNNRGIGGVPVNSSCNALIQPVPTAVDDPEDLVALAASIRQSLIDYRNDITAAAQFASMGNKFRKFVEESLCADFTPTGPRMVVNSTRRIDWTSAHFGYPGRTRFYHTNSSQPRSVKMFTPNPTRLSDGSWKDNTGSIEAMMCLRPHTKAAFQDALRHYTKELGMTGEVEFV